MRDPIDELSNFDPGPTMNPLPASEVRRRGTRLRRRNTALATIGSAAAVALIATPLALAAGGHDATEHSPVGPATQPAGGWVQTLPADFDVTAVPNGSPVAFEAKDGSPIDDFGLCGAHAFRTTDATFPATDAAGATYAQDGTSSMDGRAILLFPDDRTAAQEVDTLRQAVQDCPEDQAQGVDYRWGTVDASLPAEQSLMITSQVQFDATTLSDLSVVEVARIGNAVFIGVTHTSAAGESAIQATVPALTSLSQPVLDQMCTFSIEGCGDTAVDEGTPAAEVVPDGFPLADDYPADGTTSPSRALAPVTLEECGTTVDVPEHTDLVRAGYHADGDDRERQLVTFADEDQAQAYLTSVIDLYQNCIESKEDGKTQLVQALSDISGYDAAGGAHIRWQRAGEALPGVETVAVVRVGSSVILSTITTDEGVGPDGGKIQEQTQRAFTSIQGVVDAMADL